MPVSPSASVVPSLVTGVPSARGAKTDWPTGSCGAVAAPAPSPLIAHILLGHVPPWSPQLTRLVSAVMPFNTTPCCGVSSFGPGCTYARGRDTVADRQPPAGSRMRNTPNGAPGCGGSNWSAPHTVSVRPDSVATLAPPETWI